MKFNKPVTFNYAYFLNRLALLTIVKLCIKVVLEYKYIISIFTQLSTAILVKFLYEVTENPFYNLFSHVNVRNFRGEISLWKPYKVFQHRNHQQNPGKR